MMPKNIVLLCDGTSNEISEDRTNILRLYGTLTKDSSQIVFYDPGVGTFGAANAISYYTRRTYEVLGLMTGWGIDQNVKEAYKFLIEHFRDGDRIYIFGFSRGAYTARILAGFIHAVGLIDKINVNLLDYAYNAYKGVGGKKTSNKGESAFAEVRLFERMLRPRRLEIHCLGLFDTVGSVFEFGRFGPRLRSHAFTNRNNSVKHIRHVLAIDEKRTMFQPQLWEKNQEFWGGPFRPKDEKKIIKQDVAEIWFSGVHADIGGGYPERNSQLAKIPLQWMITETKKLGLNYKTRTINEIVLGKGSKTKYVSPDPLAPKNKSMTFGWSILEYFPRKLGAFTKTQRPKLMGWYVPLFEPRNIPEDAKIHPSVFARRGTQSDYDQPNVPVVHKKK